MKRRNDCLELQRQFSELERGMRRHSSEYEGLLRALAKAGKPNTKPTKTTYWHWLAERGDFPEVYFYATPPIGEASESDRILITGINVNARDMYEILRDLEVYQRVMEELRSRRGKLPSGNVAVQQTAVEQPGNALVIATRAVAEYGVKPEYTFSARVGSFWEQFFGEEEFLDHPDKISVPRAIIGTGSMRNKNAWGSETLDVRKRLEDIASAWDIPTQFIESWAP